MTAQATFGIDITASDKTAKGKKSAEKNLAQISKNLGTIDRKAAEQSERTVGRSGRRMVRTFGEVEKAAARAFGGKSITGDLADRLGAARSAASALGSGLGEASAAGGILEGALGGVAVAGAATVGVLAAAAYAAFKVANGWAKGAASIGRTADIIGVGTKAFQEFTIAAERAGVSRDQAAGAIGGLSQTLNDARYGRNNEALALLSRLGVAIKTKSDGTVDVKAMMPAIADAAARQNSSGQRTMSRILGYGAAGQTIFGQGGATLKADMADVGKNGAVIAEQSIVMAKRVVRKAAMVGEAKDRVMSQAGEATAGAADRAGVYDAFVQGGRYFTGAVDKLSGSVSHDFAPGAAKIDRAGGVLEKASQRFEGAVNYAGGGGGRLTREGAISEARKGVRLRDKLVAQGAPLSYANAIAANAVRESGANYQAREKGGNGRGLFQITDKARKALFRRITGVDVENSSEDQQIHFALYELEHSEKKNWQRALANGNEAGSVAAGYARYVERPANPDRDGAERAAVARALSAIPVHVTVEHKNAPPGTRTTVKAGRGPAPAISHAFEPVHGG
ncbi:phage tail tip lysozyme [Sphingomonas sp. BE137]|uniref:phage tail tip lysozyme n=1 Tax=Sphingomonas sp. BE137 TaxID=2817844 RepID=UPI001AE2EE17|nr:phage tail tip lysozyme [Sphingomonas sp. BE137]MDR6850393.1 hypothetical protein [Sphingomonas sp. BE137]